MNVAEEIEELRAMKIPDLIDRYREVWGKEPRCKNKTYLWRRIAWRIQEQRFGGLSEVAKRRLNELISEIDLPLPEKTRTASGALRKPRRPDDPTPGTVLTRTWKGQEIRLLVREDGYEWHGEFFRSLTAVARAVTGSKWNGRLFFGLTNRKKAQ